MIILQESASTQTIRVIPRSNTFNTIQVRDEQTNEVVNITSYTATAGDYYTTIQAVFTLAQDHFYTLTISQNTNIVYRDKIFCTNQAISTYSVNNNTYTSNATNNDFIIYE